MHSSLSTMQLLFLLTALSSASALVIRGGQSGLDALEGQWYLTAVSEDAYNWYTSAQNYYNATCDCPREMISSPQDTRVNTTSTCTLRPLDNNTALFSGEATLTTNGSLQLVNQTSDNQFTLQYQLDGISIIFNNGTTTNIGEASTLSVLTQAKALSLNQTDHFDALYFLVNSTNSSIPEGNTNNVFASLYFDTPNVDNATYTAAINQLQPCENLVRLNDTCPS